MAEASIAELLQFASKLEEVSDSPRLDLEVLLCDVLDKPRSYLYTWPEKILSAEMVETFSRHLADRQRGVPVAHLVGRKEFWSLALEVNAQTLIPRPETELLVETALAVIDKPDARVLDLGTGTGAIALALGSERSQWHIIAVDIIEYAVALAELNRQRLGITNVFVQHSNWFESLTDRSFDLIVANPPYIAPDDEHLRQGDVRFEPITALVAGNGGLSDIEKIVTDATDYLVSGGRLLIEHGYQQGAAVRALLISAGFAGVSTLVDGSGHERLSQGQLVDSGG